MTYRFPMVLLIAALSGPAGAQEERAEATIFDFLREGDALPTVESVRELEAMAQNELEAENCEGAIPLLRQWARQAEAVSDMLDQGSQPRLAATPETQTSFLSNSEVATYERTRLLTSTRFLLLDRNRALVQEAQCLHALGRTNEAAVAAYQALEFIEIHQTDEWDSARYLLWDIAGFDYE